MSSLRRFYCTSVCWTCCAISLLMVSHSWVCKESHAVQHDQVHAVIAPWKWTSVYDKLLTEFANINWLYMSDSPPKHDVMHHISTTGPPTSLLLGTWMPPCRRARIRSYAEVGHRLHTALLQQLVLTAPHGSSKDTRRLAILRWLPCSEQLHSTWPVPNAAHSGFHVSHWLHYDF